MTIKTITLAVKVRVMAAQMLHLQQKAWYQESLFTKPLFSLKLLNTLLHRA
jgi:hypothetical protein